MSEKVTVQLELSEEDIQNLSMMLGEAEVELEVVLKDPAFHLAGEYDTPEEMAAMLEDINQSAAWCKSFSQRLSALNDELIFSNMENDSDE